MQAFISPHGDMERPFCPAQQKNWRSLFLVDGLGIKYFKSLKTLDISFLLRGFMSNFLLEEVKFGSILNEKLLY
jgi:uncharacterized protein YqkB